MEAFTQEEVVKMAKQAGFNIDGDMFYVGYDGEESIELLERLASIVDSAERDACVKVADEKEREYMARDMKGYWSLAAFFVADAIRARGKA